jgi:hypothetical protein
MYRVLQVPFKPTQRLDGNGVVPGYRGHVPNVVNAIGMSTFLSCALAALAALPRTRAAQGRDGPCMQDGTGRAGTRRGRQGEGRRHARALVRGATGTQCAARLLRVWCA